MSIAKFLNNFFEKSEEDLIAKKYNVSFERGLSVDGLCVGDFNYLAQSYSRNNLVEIAELLNMSKENRLIVSAIIEEEMHKDSSTGNYREKVTNAKMNFENFSKIIKAINNYADDVQQ